MSDSIAPTMPPDMRIPPDVWQAWEEERNRRSQPGPPPPKGALRHGGYRVLITGGRDFWDRQTVWTALDRIAKKHGVVCLISGCATGADTLGLEWAESRCIPIARYPVSRGEWKTLGKSAGHIRNARMVNEGLPDILVAFPGGRGTADCVAKCHAKGVLVWDPITNEVT